MTEENQSELSVEDERASRLKDMLLMCSMESIAQLELLDTMVEINLRYIQYRSQSFSLDFKVLQSIQDFNRYLEPLQIKERGKQAKLNVDEPVARIDGKDVYVNKYSEFEVFTFDKPK